MVTAFIDVDHVVAEALLAACHMKASRIPRASIQTSLPRHVEVAKLSRHA